MKNKKNLTKKWQGLLNENSLKHKDVISNLLENSYKESGYFLDEEILSEDGVQSSFIDSEPFLIKPVVEGVVANSVAKELVQVYPLTKGPIGSAFAFDYLQAPTDDNPNGNVYVGNTASFKFFPSYSSVAEGIKPSPIRLKVLDLKLDAKNGYERKVLFELTEELKQDIKSQLDSETGKIISNALSSEISIGIDFDVLEFARTPGNSQVVSDFVWTIAATEITTNPARKLEARLLGEVGEFSGRSAGMASAIVISQKLIAAFALMNKFEFEGSVEEETASVLLKIGKLGPADVYVNSVTIVDATGTPTGTPGVEEVLIFKKSNKKGTFAGIVYAPYDFRILKPATNPDTFAEIHSLIHRYDIGKFEGGEKYYKRFNVTGITETNYPHYIS